MEGREISMLYVGDSSVVAYLHKYNYRKMGITTHFASNLAESLALLREKKIDVIVVNINSLHLDTAKLTKDLSSQKNRKIPLVATGIPSSPKTREVYLKDGANLFVEQPLPLSVFVEKIISLLGGEARSSERTSEGFLGSVFCYEDKALIECALMDLSEGGAKIKSPGKLSPSKGTFKMFLKGRKKPFEFLGEIKPFTGKALKEELGFFYRLIFIKILEEDLVYIRALISEDSEARLASYYYD